MMSVLAQEILLIGLVDFVGLWEIIRNAKRLEPSATGKAIQDSVVNAIAELLERGFVTPGEPTPDGGFADWALDSDEALKRVRNDWTRLGSEPNVGDIVWLANTQAGDEKARRLVAARGQ